MGQFIKNITIIIPLDNLVSYIEVFVLSTIKLYVKDYYKNSF